MVFMKLTKDNIRGYLKNLLGKSKPNTEEEQFIYDDLRSRFLHYMIESISQGKNVEEEMSSRIHEFIAREMVLAAEINNDEGHIKNEYTLAVKDISKDVLSTLQEVYNVKGNQIHAIVANDLSTSMNDYLQSTFRQQVDSPLAKDEMTLSRLIYLNNSVIRSKMMLNSESGLALTGTTDELFANLPDDEKIQNLNEMYKYYRTEVEKTDTVNEQLSTLVNNDRVAKGLAPLSQIQAAKIDDFNTVLARYDLTLPEDTSIQAMTEDESAKARALHGLPKEAVTPLPARANMVDQMVDKADAKVETMPAFTNEQKAILTNGTVQEKPTAKRVDRSEEISDDAKSMAKSNFMKEFYHRHKVPILAASAFGVAGLHVATGGLSTYGVVFLAGGMANRMNVYGQIKDAVVRTYQKAHTKLDEIDAKIESVIDKRLNQIAQFKNKVVDKVNSAQRRIQAVKTAIMAAGQAEPVLKDQPLTNMSELLTSIKHVDSAEMYDRLADMTKELATFAMSNQQMGAVLHGLGDAFDSMTLQASVVDTKGIKNISTNDETKVVSEVIEPVMQNEEAVAQSQEQADVLIQSEDKEKVTQSAEVVKSNLLDEVKENAPTSHESVSADVSSESIEEVDSKMVEETMHTENETISNREEVENPYVRMSVDELKQTDLSNVSKQQLAEALVSRYDNQEVQEYITGYVTDDTISSGQLLNELSIYEENTRRELEAAAYGEEPDYGFDSLEASAPPEPELGY